MLRRDLDHLLHRGGRGPRHDEGNVRVARGLRQHDVAAAAVEADAAGRRDAERAGIGAPEERGALVDLGDIDEVARQQRPAAECILVLHKAVLVVDAALDEVVDNARQPPLGDLAQVFQVDGVGEIHGGVASVVLLLVAAGRPAGIFWCASR